jgi:hypothetical protein
MVCLALQALAGLLTALLFLMLKEELEWGRKSVRKDGARCGGLLRASLCRLHQERNLILPVLSKPGLFQTISTVGSWLWRGPSPATSGFPRAYLQELLGNFGALTSGQR